MIEEIAIVSKVHEYQVSVQSTQTSSCSRCAQKQSCATSLLDKFIGKRDIRVDTDLDLQCGDKVLVAIDEAALLKGSLLLYITPLLALLLGGMVGEFVAEGLSMEALTVLFAFTFFALSLLIIHKIQRSGLMQYFARPVVLRKL